MRRIVLTIISVILLGLPVSVTGKTGYFFTSVTDQLTSSMIQSVLQDSRGQMWIATEFGLNKFDGYLFTSYFNNLDNKGSLCFNSSTALFNDSEGRLWVGTVKGLDRYDPATDSFIHYPADADQQPRVNCIMQLHDGRLLVGTAGYGLMVVDHEEHKLKPMPAGMTINEEEGYWVRMTEDSHGNLWKSGIGKVVTVKNLKTDSKPRVLVSSKGIVMDFVERDGEMYVVCQRGIMAYRNGTLVDAGIGMSEIGDRELLLNAGFLDSNGNIYIGTRGNGLFRIRPGSRRLERVVFRSQQIDLDKAKIVSITEDDNHNLWVGCQSKGLVVIPAQQPQFESFSFAMQNRRFGTSVSSVCEGDDGIVWCTVQGNGVFGFDAEGTVVANPKCPPDVEFIYRDRNRNYWLGTDDALYRYNPLTGSAESVFTYDCDRMKDMTVDKFGNVYVSTFAEGLCIRHAATGRWTNYNFSKRDPKKGYIGNNWVMSLMPDSRGYVWIATSSGVSVYDPRTDSFHSQGWHKLLNGVMCLSLCETRDGDILIGTNYGLYQYDRKTKNVGLFKGGELLEGKSVAYIVQDNSGDIWCATSFGIWQWKASKQKFISYVNGNGLVQKEYVNCVGLHTYSDKIYFATNNGITAFRPSEVVNIASHVDSLRLTAFLLGSVPVNTTTLSNGSQVTDTEVMFSRHFTISYMDNTFSMCFSQLNICNSENIVLEYRLNGSNVWTRNREGNNTITFNHLQPGYYTIEVRALSYGAYSPVTKFTVTVLAPWYRSTVAILLYILAALLLACYVFMTYARRRREQLDEEKMKFLINATHDIRSPLTLILSPLRKLQKCQLGDEVQTELTTIERNVQRILTLVNQILDVRKIDKHQMHLKCRETDMVKFVSGVFKMYEYMAKERGITYHFNHRMEHLPVWVDTVNFDKVVSNLLSNAFKYTSDGGKIEVNVIDGDGKWAVVEVVDNGVGLGADGGKRIFDRFYQGENTRREGVVGTGIGLNLCKMVVDMHHGIITAENRKDTKGSIFTVKIPLGTAHLSAEEMESVVVKPAKKPAGEKNQPLKTTWRVLVVDDDEEIGQYVSSELSRFYRFGICRNGRDAIKELLSNPYDVVVSDVMMPEMDGFSLLRLIKTNVNLNHIPVIMLTSKSEVGNRLEGLEKGADAYMTKPFDIEELRGTIDNLMAKALLLKGKYSGMQQQKDKVQDVAVKGNDEALMDRIMKVINKNMGNSDFNVDMLSEEVGISRAQLHRKMKELTGIPASEFLRNIRLEQAARLLRERRINVTQVAYAVGFSNLAHFSTVFRKHFGMSPTEYTERNAEEN